MTATGWDPARRKSWGRRTAMGKHNFVKLSSFSQTAMPMRFAIRGRTSRFAKSHARRRPGTVYGGRQSASAGMEAARRSEFAQSKRGSRHVGRASARCQTQRRVTGEFVPDRHESERHTRKCPGPGNRQQRWRRAGESLGTQPSRTAAHLTRSSNRRLSARMSASSGAQTSSMPTTPRSSSTKPGRHLMETPPPGPRCGN